MVQENAIEAQARKVLDEEEIKLASHLSLLLSTPGAGAYWLVKDILPVYEKERRVFEPRNIYKSLAYVHNQTAVGGDPHMMRYFLHSMGSHLETCLHGLFPIYANNSLGKVVSQIQRGGLLHTELAQELLDFNNIVYVHAKHLDEFYPVPVSIDETTFGFMDGALAFVMFRRLSMKLFKLLRLEGVGLPQDWKEFKEEWLSGKSQQ